MNYSRTPQQYKQKENSKQMFNSQVNSLNLKDSASTGQYTKAKSHQNLHVLKLQSKALELLKKIQNQKFQIYTLTEQTQNLTKICDEQKSYLKSLNVDMMKQEYEEQLSMLELQKKKLLELILNLKEQKDIFQQQKHQKITTARYQNQLLSQKIQQALLQKQQLLKALTQNRIIKDQYQKEVNQQQQKIDELRHVQRKVVISLKQLQALKEKQNQLC